MAFLIIFEGKSIKKEVRKRGTIPYMKRVTL